MLVRVMIALVTLIIKESIKDMLVKMMFKRKIPPGCHLNNNAWSGRV